MRDKNTLKCPNCGFAVLTEATLRYCAKCGSKMYIVTKEHYIIKDDKII